ncbi:hypothetical protein CALVIDRAFT_556008 [Calocera viscosa TUFC12733]|uniref:Protein kinase domain-containing protein n=1 Tax=Calocera viscosa (strain TUFC12733) TaxID=1330018 RepID=A0A167KVE2_CALVF|nr:hypothetical protein CALVIDRAFT_556008 [Calocera viscosa TUFC12733]
MSETRPQALTTIYVDTPATQSIPTPVSGLESSAPLIAPPAALAQGVEPDANSPYGLTTPEQNWSNIYWPLDARGYQLRPRYRPGWVGSWVGTKRRPESCEDSIGISPHGVVIDAVRKLDNAQVLFKLWSSQNPRDAMELPVLRYFSDPTRAKDPGNHCVPVLDTFSIEEYAGYFELLLVEPLLRDWKEPPFLIVAEALSFVLQLLEGLEYMHAHNVAHGDIHSGNILMDASKLFPQGFHGAFNLVPARRRSEKGLKRLTRLQVPTKYQYVDFGSSVMFPSFEARSLVNFTAAAWIPPEVQENPETPYDPFKADIYALGLTLMDELRDRPQLRFIIPTFDKTLSHTPDERPTASELKQQYIALLRKIPVSEMRGKVGWASDIHVGIRERISHWFQYLKLWRHSYKYGLPQDVMAARAASA